MGTSWLLGAGLGALAAAGALLAVGASPPRRPIRLADRLAPYLAPSGEARSRLLGGAPGRPASSSPLGALLATAVRRPAGWIDRLVGGGASVRRRLAGLGSRLRVEEFRIEQLIWGAGAMLLGATSMLAVGLLRGALDPVLVVGAALGGGLLGVLGRDWWLSRQLARREQLMLAEFPVVADLLALAVVAGEAPIDALERVCRRTGGELAAELRAALAQARAGSPIGAALAGAARRTTLEPLTRFLDGLVVAIERGTPLAGVLRAQAMDVREAGKRALLEAGGRKEISMMSVVVFLVLPVTVLFALFPGLLTITSLAR